MKTGMSLLTEIGECSSEIANLTRFITSHGMADVSMQAMDKRLKLIERREELRKQMATLPDLSFS